MSRDSLEKEPHPEKVEVLGLMALRVKVATLCGWTSLSEEITGLWGWTLNRQKRSPSWVSGRSGGLYPVPDYPNDLNACAEFEKLLTEQEAIRYGYWLTNEAANFRVNIDAVAMPASVFLDALRAPAEQRCRAFIATMEGKSNQ